MTTEIERQRENDDENCEKCFLIWESFLRPGMLDLWMNQSTRKKKTIDKCISTSTNALHAGWPWKSKKTHKFLKLCFERYEAPHPKDEKESNVTSHKPRQQRKEREKKFVLWFTT